MNSNQLALTKKSINQQCCNVIGLNFAKFCNSFFMKSCAEQHEKDDFFREFLVVRIFFTPTLPTLSHSKESCVYWLSERTSISVHSIHKSNCFRRKKISIFFSAYAFHRNAKVGNGISLPKLLWHTVRKNCF